MMTSKNNENCENCGMEKCECKYVYDDKGVLCYYDKEKNSYEPLEEHCIDCGYVDDECECHLE